MTITVSIRSLRCIVRRHNLQPDGNNNYRLTGAMIAEAQALDTVASDLKLDEVVIGISTNQKDHLKDAILGNSDA